MDATKLLDLRSAISKHLQNKLKENVEWEECGYDTSKGMKGISAHFGTTNYLIDLTVKDRRKNG
jgi:hypothetical protein